MGTSSTFKISTYALGANFSSVTFFMSIRPPSKRLTSIFIKSKITSIGAFTRILIFCFFIFSHACSMLNFTWGAGVMSAVVPPQIQTMLRVRLPTVCFSCDVWFTPACMFRVRLLYQHCDKNTIGFH